jgi:hypothetical protein
MKMFVIDMVHQFPSIDVNLPPSANLLRTAIQTGFGLFVDMNLAASVYFWMIVCNVVAYFFVVAWQCHLAKRTSIFTVHRHFQSSLIPLRKNMLAIIGKIIVKKIIIENPTPAIPHIEYLRLTANLAGSAVAMKFSAITLAE